MLSRNANLLIVTLMLAWAFPAGAAMDQVEEVYELDISDVQLPATAAGQVVIRRCVAGDCDMQQLPVGPETTYHVGVNTPAVSLSEFRQAAMGMDKLIYVFHGVATGTVTRIVLSTASEVS